MPENNAPVERDRTPIVESPSGTTDPDNANSGPTAYVLFGLAIALLVACYLGLTSCVDSVGQLVSATYDAPGRHELDVPTGHDWDDEPLYDGTDAQEDPWLDDGPLTRV